MSGPIATEYAAQVAAPTSASRIPPRSLEMPPLAPRAMRTTPKNEIPAASQCRSRSVSEPKAHAMSPTKIGSVPNTSATVAAVVSLTAYENETWFSQIPRSAAMTRSGTSARCTLSDPSCRYVNAENMSPPTAKRIEEYESGAQPCVNAYFTTVKLKLQKSTVTSSRM